MTGKWLRDKLSTDQVEQISKEVHAAESGTWGEIVPMIVSSSTPGRSAEWVLSLLILLLATPASFVNRGHWMFWASEVLIVVLAIILPTPILRYFPTLRRWLIPREDLSAAVHSRAIIELEDVRLRHTERRTGVLLMVSWFERKVVVIGDEAISKKIKPEEWQSMVEDFAADLKAGQLAQGFTKSIRRTGEILRQHFPAEGHNADEIRNDLVIKD